VAGTNGKGSVAAMIEMVLRRAGYVTGLYTSPHLLRFNERVRVVGEAVTDDDLTDLVHAVQDAEDRMVERTPERRATFFEFTTALALEHFRRRGIQIAVLETGLGGRLDSTNVVHPLVSVLTGIGLDHSEFLGDRLEEVAAEKCGIIKPGCPVVCSPQAPEVWPVVAAAAARMKSELIRAEEVVSVRRIEQNLKGQKLKIETTEASYPPMVLPLLGPHQVENAATAVAALECLAGRGFETGAEAVCGGLAGVAWPARCQLLEESPPVILDAAHNEDGARALLKTVASLSEGRPVGLVTSFAKDKDAYGFLKVWAGQAEACWVVPLEHERAMGVDRILEHARVAGHEPEVLSLADALRMSRAWAREVDGMVVVTGSLYLAGAVLAQVGS
jgi:dihydrofolate synthase/folylpolyglutamate synthase